MKNRIEIMRNVTCFVFGLAAAAVAPSMLRMANPDVLVDYNEGFLQKAELNLLTEGDVSSALCGELDHLVYVFNKDHMSGGKTLPVPREIKEACPSLYRFDL